MLVLLHCLFSCEVAAAENCAGLSAAEQQKCDDTMKALSASHMTSLKGDWRLVRTTNPNGGADAVSIIHTSDTAKSDINLAGLTFRCGKLGIDAVLVLLTSLPLQLRPMVSLKDGSNTKEFEASVIQGGEAILLPPEASKMISSPEWQADPELSVEIKNRRRSYQGVDPNFGPYDCFPNSFANLRALNRDNRIILG